MPFTTVLCYVIHLRLYVFMRLKSGAVCKFSTAVLKLNLGVVLAISRLKSLLSPTECRWRKLNKNMRWNLLAF